MRLVPVRVAEVWARPLTSMLRPSAHWARHPSAVGRTTRCRRETRWSETTTSQDSDRPTVKAVVKVCGTAVV